MPMTTCKECQGPISTSAIACATCGARTRKRIPYSIAEKLVLLLIFVLVGVAILGQ
jgi:hypothetical protein